MVVNPPISGIPEVFDAQRTMWEAWDLVRNTYFDDESVSSAQWEQELRRGLAASAKSRDAASAYAHLDEMLAALGDPYTRRLPPATYDSFKVSSDGEVQGVGLLLASNDSGELVVLGAIEGSPAQRAGVQAGDVLTQVDGQPSRGWLGEQAAAVLRGRGGTLVNVQLARAARPRSDQAPGQAATPPPREVISVALRREKVLWSPVFSTTVAREGRQLGYIRLGSFSAHAADDMAASMGALDAAGVEGFILDLRHNGGGLVTAGLDVARLWLDAPSTVLNVTGRVGEPRQRVVVRDASPLTRKPLVVLVDEATASASEILAGALQDNDRAAIIGSRTYGKGKIQTVFELQDGSALFVTVAQYLTPHMTVIDKVGIQPDSECGVLPDWGAAPGLEGDGCVIAAESHLLAATTAQG